MGLRQDPITAPCDAYPYAQRRAHAEQHILSMSALKELDRTSCWHICKTYGIPDFIDELKALRCRFRNELSFGEGK